MRTRMKEAISETVNGLHDIGLIDDATLEEMESIMEEKEYELQLYHGKRGYKWRFLIDGNIKCVGTDWCETMEAAREDASEILENIWKLEYYE